MTYFAFRSFDALLIFTSRAQELLHEALVTEIQTAPLSSLVFLSMPTVNSKLLGVASRVMGLYEEDAPQKLQKKMMLPVRMPAKGPAMEVAYQYVKRVVWHLNSSLSATSVTKLVKRTHAIKDIG